MRKIWSLFTRILAIALCFSCIDIFESDLSDTRVELISPRDSLVTFENSQKFWWASIKGSLWYELQVVSPDFSSVASLKLDTVIEINYFQLSLQPGVYHWRVRALNGSSTSDYSENAIIIKDPEISRTHLLNKGSRFSFTK